MILMEIRIFGFDGCFPVSLCLKLVSLIESDDSLAVSSISCWEVVLLDKFNRIELPFAFDERLKGTLSGSDVIAMPINAFHRKFRWAAATPS